MILITKPYLGSKLTKPVLEYSRGIFDRNPGREKSFRSRILIKGEDECWPWTGRKHPQGYGRPIYYGRDYLAHRLMWALTFGDPPEDLLVLHKCGIHSCCNPKHLYLGTHTDNANDWLVAKGRKVIDEYSHLPHTTAWRRRKAELRRRAREG